MTKAYPGSKEMSVSITPLGMQTLFFQMLNSQKFKHFELVYTGQSNPICASTGLCQRGSGRPYFQDRHDWNSPADQRRRKRSVLDESSDSAQSENQD